MADKDLELSFFIGLYLFTCEMSQTKRVIRLFELNGISTLHGYLMLNPVYIYDF